MHSLQAYEEKQKNKQVLLSNYLNCNSTSKGKKKTLTMEEDVEEVVAVEEDVKELEDVEEDVAVEEGVEEVEDVEEVMAVEEEASTTTTKMKIEKKLNNRSWKK